MTNSQTEALQIVLLCGVLTAPLLTAYALWRRGQRKWAWAAGCVGAILWIPVFWPAASKPLNQVGGMLLFCGGLTVPFFGAISLWRHGERLAALLVATVGVAFWIPLFAPLFVPPGSLRPPAEQRERNCGGKQMIIRNAKYMWAHGTKQPDTAIPQPSDLVPYILSGVLPVCPEGGTYILGAVNERTRCSLPNHNRGRGPTASIFPSSSTDGLLAVTHLGAANEPPRCSHADKGHLLTPPR